MSAIVTAKVRALAPRAVSRARESPVVLLRPLSAHDLILGLCFFGVCRLSRHRSRPPLGLEYIHAPPAAQAALTRRTASLEAGAVRSDAIEPGSRRADSVAWTASEPSPKRDATDTSWRAHPPSSAQGLSVAVLSASSSAVPSSSRGVTFFDLTINHHLSTIHQTQARPRA